MIRFGPSGNSDEFYEQGYKHTHEAMKWICDMGLTAFEYSFGRGVNLKQDTAKKIGEEAQNYGIALSVHAPYYINLSANGQESRDKNIAYILKSANAAKAMGAKRMVVHPGSCSGMLRSEAINNIKTAICQMLDMLEEEDCGDVLFCPETMGKVNQIGSLEEIMDICRLDERLIPAIDFGHLYARTQGGIRTADDFKQILDVIENTLGFERLSHMHCHFSKIEFTAQGEKRHLTFDQTEYGPDYEPLLRFFAERKLCPVVICESRGTMAKDALSMKKVYDAYAAGKEIHEHQDKKDT
jgi:deoxyribonuclease-4